MLLAKTYLGHRETVGIDNPARVVLSDTERRRSRVRTETTDGREVGIVVSRELGDGDVLEGENGTRIVVELARVDVAVVPVGDLQPAAALKLGHEFGNRHWDLAIRDGEALVPVPDSRDRTDEALDRLLPPGIEPRYDSVPPTTFDDATAADRGHVEGRHTHEHDHSHRGSTVFEELRSGGDG